MNTSLQVPRRNDFGSISSIQQSDAALAASQHVPADATLLRGNSTWKSDIWGIESFGGRSTGASTQAPRQGWSLNVAPEPASQAQAANSAAASLNGQKPNNTRNGSSLWSEPLGVLSRAQPPRRASAFAENTWTSNSQRPMSQRPIGPGGSFALGSALNGNESFSSVPVSRGTLPPLQLTNGYSNSFGMNGPTSGGSEQRRESLGRNGLRDPTLRELADSAVSFSPTDDCKDSTISGPFGSIGDVQARNGFTSRISLDQDSNQFGLPFNTHLSPISHMPGKPCWAHPRDAYPDARNDELGFSMGQQSQAALQRQVLNQFTGLGLSHDGQISNQDATNAQQQPGNSSESSLASGRKLSGDIEGADGPFNNAKLSFLPWSESNADVSGASRRSFAPPEDTFNGSEYQTLSTRLPNGASARRSYNADSHISPGAFQANLQPGQFGMGTEAPGLWPTNGQLVYGDRRQPLLDQREDFWRQQHQLQQQQQQQQQQQLPQMPTTPCSGQFAQGLSHWQPPMLNMPYLQQRQPVMQPKPPQDCEPHQAIRSKVLDDFRANLKSCRRYELKDIYGHIIEFSGDREGSKFIQVKLEQASGEEKERVFQEIRENALSIMRDIFGNYVIQKFFEHGNQSQKRVLGNMMMGQILSLSTQIYGCRVVQTALEHVLVDQKIAFVQELKGHRDGQNLVIKCVKDQNGNHVIQRAIERVPHEHIGFIIDTLLGQIQHLATHDYGCRVIQRMLEYCHETVKQRVLRELFACAPTLISDKFGNYVTQHVIEHGKQEDRDRLIGIVMRDLVAYSRQKCASNVVESCIKFGSEEQKHQIALRICQKNERGDNDLPGLIKDPYGNYVIQCLLDNLSPTERDCFVNMLRPELVKSRLMGPSKQVDMIATRLDQYSPRSNGCAHTQSMSIDENKYSGPNTQTALGHQQSGQGHNTVSGAQDPVFHQEPERL